MLLPGYQQATFWEVPQTVNQYTILGALERLLRKPVTEEMRIKYGHCRTVDDFMDTFCNDHVNQRFLIGDTNIGALCEMYIALRCDLTWLPMEGFDVYGGVLNGLEIAGVRIQVRHSKRFACNNWKFKVTDSTGGRRYDILACVGFAVNPTGLTGFTNPRHSDVFVIPVSQINARQEIQISRTRLHIQSGGMNSWWKYHVEKHNDIGQVVINLAHGKPMRLESQISLFDMDEWQD